MTGKMIAYCGLDCAGCKAYIATQSGDAKALAKVAEEWSKAFGATLTAESIMCDGCKGNGRKIAHCAECEVRACAREMGVPNCAHCGEYACETLTAFLAHAGEAKTTLETIRRTL
jgi:hypothetical protein